MIKIQYVCDDGTTFDFMSDATDYEQGLREEKIREFVSRQLEEVCCVMQYKDSLVEFICDNFDELKKEIFN